MPHVSAGMALPTGLTLDSSINLRGVVVLGALQYNHTLEPIPLLMRGLIGLDVATPHETCEQYKTSNRHPCNSSVGGSKSEAWAKTLSGAGKNLIVNGSLVFQNNFSIKSYKNMRYEITNQKNGWTLNVIYDDKSIKSYNTATLKGAEALRDWYVSKTKHKDSLSIFYHSLCKPKNV